MGWEALTGCSVPDRYVLAPMETIGYATGTSENELSVFSRNATTGALTFNAVHTDNLSGVDGLATPAGLAESPDGQNLYVAGQTDNAVAVFAVPTADLAITKTASPVEARVGQSLAYTLTVTNNGPGTANSVTVTDTLPGTVTFVSAPGCTGTTTLTCTTASLANGANVQFTITVTAPNVTGSISNTASVTAPVVDATSSDDTVTLVTAVLGFPPVPAIGAWALGGLALMFGGFVFFARRRRVGAVA
jgi:uncharacterized repeat protein (TIGR01451 family)